MKYTYKDIEKGNRKAIEAEIEKQKENIDKYDNAVFADAKAMKMCLASIDGIKNLMYEVSDIAKKFGHEDLQIKAGFMAVRARNVYFKYIAFIEAEQEK